MTLSFSGHIRHLGGMAAGIEMNLPVYYKMTVISIRNTLVLVSNAKKYIKPITIIKIKLISCTSQVAA